MGREAEMGALESEAAAAEGGGHHGVVLFLDCMGFVRGAMLGVGLGSVWWEWGGWMEHSVGSCGWLG